ncbi:MAG: pyruvate formate lyase family protein [Bacteroidales bacterium]|jgi:pyruvate formate-lyase/glycerol dehydratase family glycyl radical enzyme
METLEKTTTEKLIIGSTQRVQQLKKDLVSKACYNGKYEKGIYVDIDRANLYTEAYKNFQSDEPVIRRAKVLKYVLSNIPISILDNELIVANPHADPHALPIFPEINVTLLTEAIADGYVLDKDKETAEELVKFWTGKTIASKVAENMSEQTKDIVNTASSFISFTWKDGIQHCVPDWDYTFANGTNNIRKKIKEKFDEVFNEIDKGNSTQLSELINKRYQYEAMLISLDALEIFTDRFSKLASEMASKEKDSKRAEEFKKISKILSKVLKNKPESFHEACQGFYFLHLILNCIDSASFGSLCRIDQCLWQFYEKDVIIEKNITRTEAHELIECLILKVEALGGFFSRVRRMHFEGNGALPIWTIGGMNKDGSDACNELTDTVLQAARSVRCNQPTISILYHKKMRSSSLAEAIKTVRTGLGYPSFTNTNWAVSSLMRQGMPIEAARNAGVVGCVSVCPVDSCNTTKRLALEIIAAKAVELALNEGKCIITGKQLGPKEKPATEFKTYEEIFEAVKKQYEFSVKTAVNVRNLSRHFEKLYRPNPLASSFHRTPLEKGIDAVNYEDYPNNYWLNIIGAVNVINSLTVIKKLVFEDKKYAIADFVKAMKSNWQGLESFRQEVINKVPKFGNDNPYVDKIAYEVLKTFSDIAEKSYDINGGYWSILAQSVSIYQSTAKMTSALPDGKMLGFPLADGGISPDHGTDKNGIFAVLNSGSKIDHHRTKGMLLNQWIAPEMLEGEEGIEWMKALMEMWADKGLSQAQFNVVDPKVLRAAQKNPEKYPHLTVRVSGYTANWVKLTKELQEMILARTVQVN